MKNPVGTTVGTTVEFVVEFVVGSSHDNSCKKSQGRKCRGVPWDARREQDGAQVSRTEIARDPARRYMGRRAIPWSPVETRGNTREHAGTCEIP